MINKHLTYEEWFNEYKDYKDAYKNYVKLQSENDELQYENIKLKKQKDDVVEFIHKELDRFDCEGSMSISMRISYFKEDLLRMLGEIDVKD